MSVSDAAARAKHDLGKYVCFQVRWLPDDADDSALRRALEDDLLRTRRAPSGDQSAAEVWAGLRGELEAAPGFSDIDAAVGELARRAVALAAMDRRGLDDTAALARRLAEMLRDLARAVA